MCMGLGFNEDKGSFQPHKINKNDNYAGSLERRSFDNTDLERLYNMALDGSANRNENVSVEGYWEGIKYTQGGKCSEDPNCIGQHGTCVLASFAIAAYPFVQIQISQYFDAYCEYYRPNISRICKQCSYDIDFQQRIRDRSVCEQGLGAGYSLIWKLYRESQNEALQKCRDKFSLENIKLTENHNLITQNMNSLEEKLRNGSTAMLFLNKRSACLYNLWKLEGRHSIAVAYSAENKFFYRDPNYVEIRKNIDGISNIHNLAADIGDCLILTKR